MKKKKKRI